MTTDEFNNVAAELVNDIKKCFKELKSNGKNNPMFNLTTKNLANSKMNMKLVDSLPFSVLCSMI